MKGIIAIALIALSSQAVATEFVKGYVKKDGTYVAPHVRSSPNNVQWDNYSTKGNTNPYTGQQGTQRDTTYETIRPYRSSNDMRDDD